MSGHEHGHQSGDHGGHQHGHSHQHDHDFDWETWAGQLELEADTLMPLIDEVVAQHTPDVDWSTIQHVLDLGCGPGVISCALAHHAPRAHVTALDSSVQLLTRVRAHAITQQVATRVHTVEADMEAVLPALRPMDVVWAGMVLHHVANAALVLAKLHTLLHPGGTLVMIEFADAPVALPPGDPAADAWNRLQVTRGWASTHSPSTGRRCSTLRGSTTSPTRPSRRCGPHPWTTFHAPGCSNTFCAVWNGSKTS